MAGLGVGCEACRDQTEELKQSAHKWPFMCNACGFLSHSPRTLFDSYEDETEDTETVAEGPRKNEDEDWDKKMGAESPGDMERLLKQALEEETDTGATQHSTPQESTSTFAAKEYICVEIFDRDVSRILTGVRSLSDNEVSVIESLQTTTLLCKAFDSNGKYDRKAFDEARNTWQELIHALWERGFVPEQLDWPDLQPDARRDHYLAGRPDHDTGEIPEDELPAEQYLFLHDILAPLLIGYGLAPFYESTPEEALQAMREESGDFGLDALDGLAWHEAVTSIAVLSESDPDRWVETLDMAQGSRTGGSNKGLSISCSQRGLAATTKPERVSASDLLARENY